ncbi:MAG: HNH endonuclease signature motif containing protein [Planctomycetota bacterium]
MSTELFTSPKSVGELRDILNSLALTERAKKFALAIAWAYPEVFQRLRRISRLKLEDWNHDDIVAARKELIYAGILHKSNNGKSVSFRKPSHSSKPPSARCVYCDLRISGPSMTVDHVVPLSRGGSDIESNRVWACRTCNQFKADRTPAEVALMFADYRKRVRPIERLTAWQRFRLALVAMVAFCMEVIR